MSGRCTGWVLKHGPRDRAMRLVLLTIADAANADGEHAHPGVPGMVEGSLYSRSHVLAMVDRLVADGWIEVEEAGRGRGHATVYRVVMERRENVQPPDVSATTKGPVSEPKRSDPEPGKVQSEGSAPLFPTEEPTGVTTAPTSPARKRDVLWDALMVACNLDAEGATRTERGAWNRATKDLRDADATPTQVERRAREFASRWPGMSLTPTSLARRWGELGRARDVGRSSIPPNPPGSTVGRLPSINELEETTR